MSGVRQVVIVRLDKCDWAIIGGDCANEGFKGSFIDGDETDDNTRWQMWW